MPPPRPKPHGEDGELQRAVLEALWDLEQAGVQDIADRLAPQRDLAYTTILTTLQNLEKAGWVTHERNGRSYLYKPSRSRRQAGATSLRAFIKRTFAGDPGLLLQTLIEDERLTKDELARLRAMIDAKRNERKEVRDE